MKIKTLALAVAVLSGTACAGHAADIASAPAFDWTAFYFGAYASYGIGKTQAPVDLAPSDPFGGFDAGFQYQLDPVVIGLEGNISFADLDDDSGDLSVGNFATQDLDNIASVKAKIGVPLNDRTLLFGTAGWAWGETEYGLQVLGAKQKKKVDGATLGAGIQYALTDHFVARAEYLHYFYGKTTYNLNGTDVKATNSANEFRVGVDLYFN